MVYISASTTLFSEQELQEILRVSRRNNSARDITGVLLYIEGSIFQVLEGEEAAVRELYDKIKRDPRHRMVTRLIEDHRPQRNFPDWSMGYRRARLQDIRSIEGFQTLDDVQDMVNTIQKSPERAHILLRTFFSSNMR